MAAQRQLFPNPAPPQPGVADGSRKPPPNTLSDTAPVWLQRLSLFVLVMFCVVLGVILTLLPWWRALWDDNLFIASHPQLAVILRSGAARGLVSGLGLIDIWIGISEAIHYRDYRDPADTPLDLAAPENDPR